VVVAARQFPFEPTPFAEQQSEPAGVAALGDPSGTHAAGLDGVAATGDTQFAPAHVPKEHAEFVKYTDRHTTTQMTKNTPTIINPDIYFIITFFFTFDKVL